MEEYTRGDTRHTKGYMLEEGTQDPAVGNNDTPPSGDSIQAIREWGDSWKKTASEYKPVAEFVETKFGDLTNAELAHTLYSGFVSDEFDPSSFAKVLEQLSPDRASKLVENLASERANKIVPDKVQELFGGQVSPEEVKLFKQWKESGYSFGQGDDLPENLKVDKDGNPRSDEELEFLRTLKNQVKELSEGRKTTESSAREQAEYERQQIIHEQVNDFGLKRLEILNGEFEALGLNPTKDDTPDAISRKENLKKFIVHGVSGMFLADPDASRDYQSAVEHISRGESLLARRYESRIEKKLVETFRSDFLKELRQSLGMPEKKVEPRPEISNTGQTTDGSRAPKGDRESWLKSLVERGIITP